MASTSSNLTSLTASPSAAAPQEPIAPAIQKPIERRANFVNLFARLHLTPITIPSENDLSPSTYPNPPPAPRNDRAPFWTSDQPPPPLRDGRFLTPFPEALLPNRNSLTALQPTAPEPASDSRDSTNSNAGRPPSPTPIFIPTPLPTANRSSDRKSSLARPRRIRLIHSQPGVALANEVATGALSPEAAAAFANSRFPFRSYSNSLVVAAPPAAAASTAATPQINLPPLPPAPQHASQPFPKKRAHEETSASPNAASLKEPRTHKNFKK